MQNSESRKKRNKRKGQGEEPTFPKNPGFVLRVAYFLVYLLLFIIFKIFFRFSYTKRSGVHNLKGPVILASNHQSFLDPLFAIVAMKGRRMRFVVGYFLRYLSPLKGLFKILDSIPIQQFVADPSAVRAILRSLKQDETLLIYPEGQRSINGSSLHISNNLLRLAEKCGATIVTLRLKGAYLAHPRWTKGFFRLGKVEADLEILCKPEEIKEKGLEYWEERLRSQLYQDDHCWVSKNKHRYLTLRPAAGLDLLLHRCPSCNRPEALTSQGKILSCTFCKASYKFQSNLQFVESLPKEEPGKSVAQLGITSVSEWHRWQIFNEQKDFAEEDEISREKVQCDKHDYKSGKVLESYRSTLNIGRSSMFLESNAGREDLPFLKGQPLMFSSGKYVQVNLPECILRIYPDNPYVVARLVDLHL